jgi:hypothetical protein
MDDAMDEPSPRYVAAHFLMPRFLATHQLAALDAIERSDADFFIPVWFEAGFRFSPMLIHTRRHGYRFGVITYPMPRASPEAYVGVVVAFEGAATVRYFTWEESVALSFDGPPTPSTVIGEWRDRSHANHGSGPPFTGDIVNDTEAVLEQVMAILLRETS